jgi:hypothetical protein
MESVSKIEIDLITDGQLQGSHADFTISNESIECYLPIDTGDIIINITITNLPPLCRMR